MTDSTDSQRGLYGKYIVHKLDGSLVEDCFVLRPAHDVAAREALLAYAKTTPNRLLASDLFQRLSDIAALEGLEARERAEATQ